MAAPLRKIALVGVRHVIRPANEVLSLICFQGSGRLGPHILKALQADSAFEVTIITRTNSTATFPPNTKVVKVTDGYPKNEMINVFKGQDAVVLSLSFFGRQYHAALVDASITAGVKRLIASTYGGTDRSTKVEQFFPIAAENGKIIRELKAAERDGWSWTSISCGLFFDSCIKTGFFGLDPKAYTARIWDSGNSKFSATNMDTIGLAVARILAKPAETANRTVYISSFETCLTEILEAEQKATGVSEWKITHVNSDEQVKSALEEVKSGSMMAMATLALASEVKSGLHADFAAEGLLDNELLGLPRENVDAAVVRVLKANL